MGICIYNKSAWNNGVGKVIEADRAFAIDADGDVYIVETKLYKNPDKRKVVSRVLDYGASLWRHSRDFDLLLERFDNEIEKKFQMS